MLSNNHDRRILRTRKMLREALFSLLLQKGYEAISIQEITDRANLARATFYLHYRDKEALLVECVESLVQDFLSRLQELDSTDHMVIDTTALREVFEYARSQADLYRVLMRGQGGVVASRRFQELIVGYTQSMLQEQLEVKKIAPLLPFDFISHFFAGSLLAIVFWWLETGMSYSSQEMAEMYRQMHLFGWNYATGCGQAEKSGTKSSSPAL